MHYHVNPEEKLDPKYDLGSFGEGTFPSHYVGQMAMFHCHTVKNWRMLREPQKPQTPCEQ